MKLTTENGATVDELRGLVVQRTSSPDGLPRKRGQGGMPLFEEHPAKR